MKESKIIERIKKHRLRILHPSWYREREKGMDCILRLARQLQKRLDVVEQENVKLKSELLEAAEEAQRYEA